MNVWLGIIVLLVGVSTLGGEPPRVGEAELAGIWKVCYEPGLARVYEPSDGYLVLMPGGRFFELRHDCCDVAPPVPREGTYSVTGDTVVLSGGRRLRYVRSAPVLLFNDLEGEPVSRPVLALPKDLNFGYARVYPAPGRKPE